jgi:hypothetical protein
VSGTGIITPDSPLSDGLKTITYTLSDAAGNESGQSPAITLTIDTVAPSVSTPTSFLDNVGVIQNVVNASPATDDTRPGINIGAGLTDTVKLYVDGILTPATYDSGLGTLTPTIALVDGTYAVAYTLTDTAGNESALSGTISIRIDTVAPTINSVTSSWGVTLEYAESFIDGTITVATSGVEDGESASVSMNGKSYTGTVTNNIATITVPAADLVGLTNKANTSMTSTALDQAGNQSEAVTSTFYVDYTPSGWVSKRGLRATQVRGVAVNSNGDIFSVGSGSGIGTNTESTDVYVMKYNKHGVLQWQYQFYNTYQAPNYATYPGEYVTDYVYTMTIDSSDNIYFTGSTGKWDSGTQYFRDAVMIGKISSTGSFSWAKMLGKGTDTSPADKGVAMATDNNGNVYVVLSVSDNITVTYQDIVVVKYNSSGSQVWKRIVGYTIPGDTLWYDIGYSITVSSTSVYVVGRSYYAGIILKYDTSGTLLWQKSVAGCDFTSVTSDSSGNAYVTGVKSGIPPFVCKFSSNGVLEWKKTMSSSKLSAYQYALPQITCNGTDLYVLTCWDGLTDVAVLNWNTSGRFIWCNSISMASGTQQYYPTITSDSKYIYITIDLSSIIKLRKDGSQLGSYIKSQPLVGPNGPFTYDIVFNYSDVTSEITELDNSMQVTNQLDVVSLSYTIPEGSVAMARVDVTSQVKDYVVNEYFIGSERPPVITSYVDNVLAITDNFSTAPVTNDQTPGLNIGAGLTNPQLYINGTSVASVYDSVAGTLTPDSPVTPDGIYTFKYTVDTDGIASPLSSGYSITLDTVASPVTIELTHDNGSSSSDGITNNGQITISGLEVGSSWEYSTDNGSNWTVGTGTTFTLSTGSYPAGVVKVRQTDAAGNSNITSTIYTIVVDTTAPTINSVTSSWGSVLDSVESGSSGTITVATSGVEDGQTLTATINSVQYTGTVSINSVILTAPSADLSVMYSGTTYTISVSVSDLAGNSVSDTSTTFTSTILGVGGAYGGGYYAGNIVDGGVTYMLIVAPKASGANGGVSLAWGPLIGVPNARTLTNGVAASNALNGSGFPAAYYCKGLNIGGFTDWYLPARDELEILYRNLKPGTTVNVAGARPAPGSGSFYDHFGYDGLAYGTNENSSPLGVGYTASSPAQTGIAAFKTGGIEAFVEDVYWSSTDAMSGQDTNPVWVQRFTDGYQGGTSKNGSFYVRAVRREVLPVTVPDQPTGITAIAGDSSATVLFTTPYNGSWYTVTAYISGVSAGITAAGSTSPINITGLTNGTAYTFTVKATNAIGTGLESSPSNEITPVVLTVGGAYGGGYYIGNIVDGGVTYKLIVAPKASGANGGATIQWRTTNDAAPVATKTLTNGVAASNAMNSSTYPAAFYCKGLNIGGFTDWYLPARDELEILYRNLKPGTTAPYDSGGAWRTTANFGNAGFGLDNGANGFNANSRPVGSGYTSGSPAQTGIAVFKTGGTESFDESSYWSSTELDDYYVWVQYFGYGLQYYNLKTYASYVRAVRRVPL